ncbi:MAG: hypothetical protein V4510_06640 [bacterium]
MEVYNVFRLACSVVSVLAGVFFLQQASPYVGAVFLFVAGAIVGGLWPAGAGGPWRKTA